MKDQWLKLSARVDALALRERLMIFSALAVLLVYTVYLVLAEPLLVRQQAAVAEIAAQQKQRADLAAVIR